MASASRRIHGAILPVVLVTAFCASFHTVIDTDFWWHLRVGDDILAGRGIPHVDIYTYPLAGSPLIDLNWIFQIMVALIHRAAGLTGIILAKCLIVITTFWIVYRLARRDAPAALAAVLTGVGVILASERFLERPEILSLLMLAVTLWLLRRHEEGSPHAWIVLPVVTLAWVNSEALFILGPGVIAANLLDRPRDRRLWLGLGLSTVVTAANPYFLSGALQPFTYFSVVNGKMAIFSGGVGELLSPLIPGIQHPSVAIFPYFLALIVITLLLHARRPRLSEIALMAVFLYLGVRARRNLAPLAVVSVPILARWIGQGRGAELFRRRVNRIPSAARSICAASASVIVILAFLAYDLALTNGTIYETIRTNRRFGVGLAEEAAPVGAATFLRENRVGGPLLNTLSVGYYLTYAYPQEKVFVDGRFEAGTAAHYADYLSLFSYRAAWKGADEEYGFRCLLLNYAEGTGLARDRFADTTWAPVYLDGDAIVLLRNDAGNRDLIGRNRLTRQALLQRFPTVDSSGIASLPVAGRDTFLKRFFRFDEPFPWNELYLGQFFAMIGMPDLEAGEYALAVRRAPHGLTPRLFLAGSLARGGRTAEAARVLDGAQGLARTGREKDDVAQTRAEIDSLRSLTRTARASPPPPSPAGSPR